MKITIDHSQHQGARPSNARPRLIVLHADVSGSEAGTIAWLKNPQSKASYHYLVHRDGSITQLVADDRRAWHAGTSEFFGTPGVNDFSIGICFSNRQDGKEPFDPRAISAGINLVSSLCRRYAIGPESITTHEAIARPLGRKSDPGPTFPLAPFLTGVRLAIQTNGMP